jgi:lipid-binding SYLF domain-containing protein
MPMETAARRPSSSGFNREPLQEEVNMSAKIRRWSWWPLLAVVLSLASCSRDANSPAAEVGKERAHARGVLDQSSMVLREMTRGGAMAFDQRQRARCVVVVPEMASGGFIVGMRRGSGVVTCRTALGWSPPAFVTITGGSAGLQAGFEEAGVVMLVKNERGMSKLFHSNFELGADSSAAAGPVGRTAQASTDVGMSAEIVSYAHSRGLFAGVELSGAEMIQDRATASAVYGGWPDAQAILVGSVPAPLDVAGFMNQVQAAFPAS